MGTENDDPLVDLAKIRDKITHTEDVELPDLRRRRNELICIAREHGAIGDDLADAAGVSRQTVHGVLREHNVPAPNRTRATFDRRRRAELGRALVAAGIDTTRTPDEIGAQLRAYLSGDEHTEHTEQNED